MMSKIGDARESVVLEKERIDKDLQQMWESLQYLKKSVENDATLLQKADFSDLLQRIVTDLSPLSQTQDMLLLQQTLQSQENLTVTDLDKIIQEFISVKLEYTANKSLHLADISLEKYKQLVEHKSSMDALLLTITQAPTIENLVPAAQEQQDPTNEVINPIAETLDPDVIKAQQNLIDGQTSTPEDASKAESSKDAEDKSWWERAKDSSFGLAYILGANRLSSAKEWISEKWSDFKEWIGWKKKEKKQESDDVTTTETSPTSPEVVQPSVDTNKNLTEADRLLRNTYIKQSVIDTTTVPIIIDYKTDKDMLLQKSSPDKISFDVDTQSILLGGAKVKLNIPQFTMDIWGIDATVTKVDIRSIKASGNNFIIEAKGTGSAGFLEQTKDISTTLSKEKFYELLQPYLESGKVQYDTSLEFDGQKVPLKLDIAWSIEPTPSLTEADSQNFMSYKKDIYNSYPEPEKKYLDQLSRHSIDMYKNAANWLDKERLPALLQDYDSSLLTWLDGGILAIVGKQFSSVSELTKDSILWRAGNLANDFLWTIVGFLEKREDNKIIWRLAKILKWAPDKLKDLIPDGNEQKQKALRSAVEKQLRDDPAIKKDLEKVIKQFSLVRFYFTEKKAILQDKWMDTSSLDALSLPAAADFLQQQSLLDASISTKTTVWLEANRVSVVLQDLIKSTNSKDDFSAQRWKIIFNYKTNSLESWSGSTKINVSADGKLYKIDGLDMTFSDLKSVLRFANLSNRLIQQTSASEKAASNVSPHFAYHTIAIKWPWLYINNRTILPGWLWTISGMDRDKVVRWSTFSDNMPGWSDEMWELYCKYLNSKMTLFGGSLVS